MTMRDVELAWHVHHVVLGSVIWLLVVFPKTHDRIAQVFLFVFECRPEAVDIEQQVRWRRGWLE